MRQLTIYESVGVTSLTSGNVAAKKPVISAPRAVKGAAGVLPTHGREQDHQPNSSPNVNQNSDVRGPHSSRGALLTFDDALAYAERTVRLMKPGMTFTSQDLFNDYAYRFDIRRLAAIINLLRREGLIISVGVTQEGREGRNSGYATKWARTRAGWD